jgi:hypothetical protein
VVGRLVQQQQVGFGQKDLGQRDPAQFPPGETIQRPVQVLDPETEVSNQPVDPALQIVTAEAFVSLLHHAVTLDQPGIIRAIGHGRFQPLQFPGQFKHVLEGFEQGGQQTGPGVRRFVLTHEPDPTPAQANHFPFFRFNLSAHQSQQGGLAAPVGSNKSHLLCLVDLPAHPIQKQVTPVGETNGVKAHEHGPLSSTLVLSGTM